LVGAAALTAQAQTYSNAVMALHPVAYYPLNETNVPPAPVTVSITNYGTDPSLNMTPNSDVIYGNVSPLASGSTDSADYFNGGTSYVLATYDSNLGNQPPFTIEGWFLSRNISATECATADFDANSPRSGWLIYMDIANAGQYTFRAYNQNGATPSLSFNIGAAGSIARDTWYHLAVVVDTNGGTTNVSGYINGALVAGPTILPSYVPNDGLDGGLSAGCRSDAAFLFDGNISDLAYYTNALSGPTILSHYQAGTNVSPVTPYDQLVLAQNPLAFYKFNEALPALSSPYPVPLPVATNYGSFGASASGFYTVSSSPGAVAGPTNIGFDGLPALELSPTDIESAGTAGPGVFCAPFNPEEFNITGALTVAFWAQAPGASAYFETVMGRGDGSWRFDLDPSGLPHWAASPNGDIVGATSLADDKWHFWAGVYDPVAGKGTFYIDSVIVASVTWAPLSSNVQYPLLVGGAPDYWNSARNFYGNVAQVAIFTNALTATQVNSLYAAAGGSPATAGILITSVTVDAGSSTNLVATAGGSLPIGVQWYYTDLTATTYSISGATNLTLPLANVQASQSGYQYFIVATNAYGTATSDIVTLTVLSGAPTLATDVSPLSSQLPVGVADQFSVSATGSEPFYYQWYLNSAPVSGATNPVYSFTVLPGTNSYSVTISNSFGVTPGSTAQVVGLTGAPSLITFASEADWTTNSSAGAGATFPQFNGTGGLLLTDGGGGEAASAFYIFPQYIGGFVASFTYQIVAGGAADGAAFVVQANPAGATALGGVGGEIGYGGIVDSAAFELNLYTGSSGGSGIQYGTNGLTPTTTPPLPPYMPVTPVSLTSADPINVRLAYVNGVMYSKLTDTTTGATYTGSHVYGNLIPIVGSASAYVGFTGGTGSITSSQTVSNFVYSYTTSPVLSIATSNNFAIVSWPVSVSTLFTLQSSALITGPFTNVLTAPTVVNGTNQVAVPLSGTSQFFQLDLP